MTEVFAVMKKLIRIISIFSLVLFFPSYLNAGLDVYTIKIIRTAFMNGCVRSLKYDIETIKALKQDKNEFKRHVMLEVDKYIREVAVLNNEIYAKQRLREQAEVFQGGNHGDHSNTTQSSTPWSLY